MRNIRLTLYKDIYRPVMDEEIICFCESVNEAMTIAQEHIFGLSTIHWINQYAGNPYDLMRGFYFMTSSNNREIPCMFKIEHTEKR